MKKTIFATVLALGTILGAFAQQAIETPSFGDNWSLDINGGVTTPMSNHPFFKSMRPVIGLKLDKKVTPVFKIGAEGNFAINTSTVRGPHSKTAFDDSYVGIYGGVNLCNLFGGYPGYVRPFDVEIQAGAGWGHRFDRKPILGQNYFGTKFGLNFNFNVSEDVTITISPSILWDMTSRPVEQSTASYDVDRANFNLTAGVAYNFGGDGFKTVRPYDQGQIDDLNRRINELRALSEAQAADNAALAATAASLADQLEQLKNQPQPVKVVNKVTNNLESVRYIFFKIGSSVITADQQPNVEMIAAYLNNHPGSKVVIKGYASKDGPEELNIRLAQQRAESVKTALMKKYKIPASRIQAEGCGIGEMFDEESWNRVAICILDTTGK